MKVYESGVGIYKSKKESKKKERKHALDQESNQDKLVFKLKNINQFTSKHL